MKRKTNRATWGMAAILLAVLLVGGGILLPRMRWYLVAKYRGVNADLRGAALANAALHGAKLIGANLNKADLHGADLSGATLASAEMSQSNLAGADLSG